MEAHIIKIVAGPIRFAAELIVKDIELSILVFEDGIYPAIEGDAVFEDMA